MESLDCIHTAVKVTEEHKEAAYLKTFLTKKTHKDPAIWDKKEEKPGLKGGDTAGKRELRYLP